MNVRGFCKDLFLLLNLGRKILLISWDFSCRDTNLSCHLHRSAKNCHEYIYEKKYVASCFVTFTWNEHSSNVTCHNRCLILLFRNQAQILIHFMQILNREFDNFIMNCYLMKWKWIPTHIHQCHDKCDCHRSGKNLFRICTFCLHGDSGRCCCSFHYFPHIRQRQCMRNYFCRAQILRSICSESFLQSSCKFARN